MHVRTWFLDYIRIHFTILRNGKGKTLICGSKSWSDCPIHTLLIRSFLIKSKICCILGYSYRFSSLWFIRITKYLAHIHTCRVRSINISFKCDFLKFSLVLRRAQLRFRDMLLFTPIEILEPLCNSHLIFLLGLHQPAIELLSPAHLCFISFPSQRSFNTIYNAEARTCRIIKRAFFITSYVTLLFT